MLFFKKKSYHWLAALTGMFVGVLLVSEIAAVKMVALGPLVVPGAVVLFPFSYILGDVLTEVYGYAKSRQVIWTGFLMALIMVLCFAAVRQLPAAPFWTDQSAWDAILGATPRIVAASFIAYLAGEFSNSYVLAKMKIRSHGKHLWQRTIGSTVIGQGIDTVLFITIAFAGVLPAETLPVVIGSQYIVKVAIEALMTPVTYAVVKFLKASEREDAYDTKTDFNPFRWSRE